MSFNNFTKSQLRKIIKDYNLDKDIPNYFILNKKLLIIEIKFHLFYEEYILDQEFKKLREIIILDDTFYKRLSILQLEKI